MLTQQDLEHHLRREREERSRAAAAADPAARIAHLELAETDARRAEQAKIRLSIAMEHQSI